MSAVSIVKKAQPGWARLGLLCATLGALLALAAGAGYRLGWWHYLVGFQLLFAAFLTGAAGMVISLGAALTNWGLHRQATLRAVAGLAIGLLTTAIPAQWKLAQERAPAIHDITSDTDDPPAFQAASGLRGIGEHGVAYQGGLLAIRQKAAYPDIRPLHSRQSKGRVFEAARAVLKDMGFRLVGESLPEGRIEAVASSPLFGFQDDVVVRVREHAAGTRVDARSMSRQGTNDLGQNAKRLRGFFTRLRTHLRERPTPLLEK